MSVDAVGNLRGVHMCPCSCSEVCWLSVDLVQQTGRTVAIDTVFYGQEEKPLADVEREIILRPRVGLDVVILTPGVPSASVESSHVSVTADAGSISYNADEEYWEALRRKNWNMGAIWRWCWKGGGEKREEDEILGSKSLGHGDWARMKEVGERKSLVR
jgi:hypothetical protein